jgi:hypothetical protein
VLTVRRFDMLARDGLRRLSMRREIIMDEILRFQFVL